MARMQYLGSNFRLGVQNLELHLKNRSYDVQCKEWIAIFEELESNSPIFVYKTEKGFQPQLGACNLWTPQKTPFFIVNQTSKIVTRIFYDNRLQAAM